MKVWLPVTTNPAV